MDWDKLITEIVRHLYEMIQVHANRCHTPAVQTAVTHLQTHHPGYPKLDVPKPPILLKKGRVSRGLLLGGFLDQIVTHAAYQEAFRLRQLRQILCQHHEKPVRQWPLIQLGYGPNSIPCIGFKNMKIVGGRGWDAVYYYYPDDFVKLYGRAAARKESGK